MVSYNGLCVYSRVGGANIYLVLIKYYSEYQKCPRKESTSSHGIFIPNCKKKLEAALQQQIFSNRFVQGEKKILINIKNVNKMPLAKFGVNTSPHIFSFQVFFVLKLKQTYILLERLTKSIVSYVRKLPSFPSYPRTQGLGYFIVC